MGRLKNILWWMFLLVICAEIATAKKRLGGGGSKHSYPSSTGLSGGGGSKHSYPSPGGLSGGGSHSSGGLSGGNGYPGHSNQKTYSKDHTYPNSGGLSGGGSGYPTQHRPTYTQHVTQNSYRPPQQVTYTPVGGGHPQSFHPYQGPVPTYVIQNRNSGGKFNNLLTGLALVSLGTAVGTAVGHYAGSSGHKEYKPVNGEKCTFRVQKDNGDFEETVFDCKLIGNLILAEEAKKQAGDPSTSIVTTVTNTTIVNTTSTVDGGNALNNTNSSNTDSSSSSVSTVSVTTTTTNSSANTPPVEVTPGMKCFVTRRTPVSIMKKEFPCTLLQNLDKASFKGSQPALFSSTIFTFASVVFTVFLLK